MLICLHWERAALALIKQEFEKQLIKGMGQQASLPSAPELDNPDKVIADVHTLLSDLGFCTLDCRDVLHCTIEQL